MNQRFELEDRLEDDDDGEAVFGNHTRGALLDTVQLKTPIPRAHRDAVRMQAPFLNSDGKYNRRWIQPIRVKEFKGRGFIVVSKEEIAKDKAISEANFADLYQKHSGGKIFILGCGPSFKKSHAKAIQEANVTTIGLNESYRALDPENEDVSFTPTYHFHIDKPFGLGDGRPRLEKLNKAGTTVFSPEQVGDEKGLGFGRCFKMSTVWDFRSSFKLTENLTFGHGKTSLFSAMQLAVMLGAKIIVLVGIDFNVPKTGSWHFYPDRPKDDKKERKDKYRDRHFPAIAEKFAEVVKPIMRDLNIMVFNANKKSKLDCFIPMDLKELL